jgi:hypothetical protein
MEWCLIIKHRDNVLRSVRIPLSDNINKQTKRMDKEGFNIVE